MRALLLFPVVLLACGDGRPRVGDSCPTKQELSCGHLEGGDTAPLVCQSQGNTWVSAVGTGVDNPCTSACAETGANLVTCSAVIYGYQNTPCEADTSACDLATDSPMWCEDNGTWTVFPSCTGETHCGMDAQGKIAVCR